MRDHFKAMFGAMLTIQAASAAAAVASRPAALDSLQQISTDHVNLIDSSSGQTVSFVDVIPAGTTPLSLHTRSANTDVMNLPAQPIPTPPAFAMGMTVIVGLMGYKAMRRLRAA